MTDDNTTTAPRTFGAGAMPSRHRPFLRYFLTPDEGGAGGEQEGENTPGEPQEPADGANDAAGADSLGDAGKKALDAMKAERNAARTAEREAKAALAAMQAQAEGKQKEHEAAVAAQRVKDDALAAANLRIKKAELRVAAKGKLSDPADALTFIDLDAIEVDDDGNVDTAALDAAVDDLLTKKPYLAAQGGRRFQGEGDGGARNGQRQVSQLTQEDVERMTPAQVNDARIAGRLDRLLGATN